MCGLVGMTTNRLTIPEIKRFQFAAQLSALRGEQSTGTVWVDKDEMWRTHKRLGHPFDVVRTRLWNELCSDLNIRVILMHTRYATKGAVNIDNAHPFICDGVVGMHNGTIHTGIPDQYKRDVDSHGLYEYIAAEGHIKALQAVKYGAYALQWLQWHGEEEELKIHIIRNEERPLHYVDGAGFRLWMSDDEHLRFVMDTQNIKGKIEKFKPYHMYTITINEHGVPTWKIEDLTDELKKPTYYHSGQSGRFFRQGGAYNGYGGGYYDSYYDDEERWGGSSSSTTKQEGTSTDTKGSSVIPFVQDSTNTTKPKETKVSGTDNSSKVAWVNTQGYDWVSPSRYEELKKKGCAWCGDYDVPKQAESFIDEEDWMCPHCVSQNGHFNAESLIKYQRKITRPQHYHFSQFQCVES